MLMAKLVRKTRRWFAAAMLVATAGSLAQAPIVTAVDGTLAGSRDAAGISSFKGVPFAAAPVGALRWKPPAPAKPWPSTRQATQWGSACMQPYPHELLPWTKEFIVQNDVSEDCLFLNVWTPSLKTGSSLPVLVFIYGGGFDGGAGSIAMYNGAHLAKLGIVVVTINYRLGVFGFFAHPLLTAESPQHSSGNYGLEDQIAALRWVRANIARFGGNPGRVTIWGQSAGASSVGALLASPLTRGLFQGAIADSGLEHARSASGTTLPSAEKEGETFARSKGAASLKDLRAMPAADLIKGASPRNVHFRPVIDGWVLTQPTQTALEKGPDNDVPLMTGYQAADTRTFSKPPRSLNEYRQRIQSAYGSGAEQLLKLYPATDAQTAAAAYEEISQDRNRVSQWLLATRRNATHMSATYTYYMDQAIPWPQHPEFGAFHTGELPYAFGNLDKLDRPWTARDREVSRVLSAYVVNFTKTGSPDTPGLPKWPKATSTDKTTMQLGHAFAPMPLATPERLEWLLSNLGGQVTPTPHR